eukprot:TRINITY_DN578_c0_g1_i1.p1 TRINITY_DN578_c0_g1~~TRINITY_DN578_c0_g1_i1.p1  ORF type:complete len:394 (-),score=65.95 TRINITY_DN578_c0_g1_i1:407-1588(-)
MPPILTSTTPRGPKMVHLRLCGRRPIPTWTVRPGRTPRDLHLAADPLARRRLLASRSPRPTEPPHGHNPSHSTADNATDCPTEPPHSHSTDHAATDNATDSPTRVSVVGAMRAVVSAPYLPPQPHHLAGRLTLVLDLDETLVHSAFPFLEPIRPALPTPHFRFVMNNPASRDISDVLRTVCVWKRHGLHEFLEAVSSFCEVIVFTASHQSYAQPLMEILDPTKQVVHGLLFREHTVPTACGFVKDLSLLGRPLDRMVIIDNNPLSFARNPDNGIAVKSFYGEEDSACSLIHLLPFLHALSLTSDVRPVLRERFDWAHKIYPYYLHMLASQSQSQAQTQTQPQAQDQPEAKSQELEHIHNSHHDRVHDQLQPSPNPKLKIQIPLPLSEAAHIGH